MATILCGWMLSSPLCVAAETTKQVGGAFADRFETLDETRWFVSDGWSNAEWMTSTFRRSNIDILDEGVVLLAARDPGDALKPYSASEIRTKAAYRYGYFEGRLRVPKGNGLVTGLFAYAPGAPGEPVQEIDIEFLGRNTRQVELTMHMGEKHNSAIITLPFDAAEGFHTYAFEWRANAVRFFVDGKQVRKVTKAQFPMPSRELTFFLNLWPTARLKQWAGGAPSGEGPWALAASCLSYSPTYTRKSACAEP